ncbi:flagellar FlbD family protein [Treponema sp. OMZ 840]|uniref:flagellar FlbD family protein n=1 Tax=Treponema sp. OMZ 840 TaxID=244313 RepID=UPI003D8EADC8
MIEVTRLDGSLYWINPHQIEYMEQNPDLTLVMLSGKKLVVRNTADDMLQKIIAYRQRIGAFKNEL